MGRIYSRGKKRYVSVTTVLGILAKPGLWYYYGKHGTALATKLTRIARIIGTKFHKFAEIDGVNPKKANKLYEKWSKAGKFKTKSGKKLWGLVNQYWRIKERFNIHPLETEFNFYYENKKKTILYGGTIDEIGFVEVLKGESKLLLIDWKTSGAVYWDNVLQCAAYLEGLKFEHKKLYDKIEGILVISFDKKNPYGAPANKIITDKKLLHKLYIKGFVSAYKLYKLKAEKF